MIRSVILQHIIHNGIWLQQNLPWWHSATSSSILDRAIDSEESQHKDFLRLVRKHVLNCSVLMRKIYDALLELQFEPCYTICAGAYWRVPWVNCKDENLLFHGSCSMGCRVLCQGWWWCSCEFRSVLPVYFFFSSFLYFLDSD